MAKRTGQQPGRKRRTAKAVRDADPPRASLRLVGSLVDCLGARTPLNTGDPVHEVALEVATRALRSLTTVSLIELTPVLVQHHTLWQQGCVDPGDPPPGDAGA